MTGGPCIALSCGNKITLWLAINDEFPQPYVEMDHGVIRLRKWMSPTWKGAGPGDLVTEDQWPGRRNRIDDYRCVWPSDVGTGGPPCGMDIAHYHLGIKVYKYQLLPVSFQGDWNAYTWNIRILLSQTFQRFQFLVILDETNLDSRPRVETVPRLWVEKACMYV